MSNISMHLKKDSLFTGKKFEATRDRSQEFKNKKISSSQFLNFDDEDSEGSLGLNKQYFIEGKQEAELKETIMADQVLERL